MITLSLHLKYGQALLAAAKSQNAQDQVLSDVEGAAVLFKDKHLGGLMQQVSFLQPEAMRKVISSTFGGKLHVLVVNLLVMLARQKALKYLPRVAEVYRHAYSESRGIIEMTIKTSREFSPQEQLKFIDQLQAKRRHPLSVRFETDPGLIGGVQIFERSNLTDYSVKNYLETLKKQLINQQL